jgi:aminobenzoyl-glutamate utilization protein B
MTKRRREIAEAVSRIRNEIIALADAIHDSPEEAFHEHKAADLTEAALKKHGFRVERPYCYMPTALIGRRGRGRPVIGMLAEYDALPNCGSKPGSVGHGCGHNLLGAAAACGAIAAAEVLARHRLPGTVKLFGTPAEETLAGKCYMARDGAFDGLDACLAWHPSDRTCAINGTGQAMDSIWFEFFGKMAHAAAQPHQGRSALDAVELMNVAVNYLREHVAENVRIHYMIAHGGDAPNIVPRYAKSWYYVRGKDRAQVNEVRARVIDCAKGAALATGTRMKVTVLEGAYNHLPNDVLAKEFDRTLRAYGSPGFTPADLKELRRLGAKTKPERGIGGIDEKFERASSDDANVSWLVAMSRFSTACWPKGTPLHSVTAHKLGKSGVAHKGMLLAGKVLGAAAVDLVTQPKLLAAAKAEFRKKTRGFKYDPVISRTQRPPVAAER